MTTNDRRENQRLEVRVPLRFRPLVNPPAGNLRAESINLSPRGIYFASDYPLRVGSQIEMHMRMPREVSGQPNDDVHCTGRVVHIEPATFPGGKAGVGVYIESFEAAAGASFGAVEQPDSRTKRA